MDNGRRISLISWTLVSISTFSVVAFIFLHPVGNSDIFWQIKAGEYIGQNGLPPGKDIFSYVVQGSAWIDLQWLTELLFFSVERVGGFVGLSVLSTALGLVLLLLLLVGLKRMGVSAFRSLILITLILMFSSFRLQLLRPELFCFIFFAAFLVTIDKRGKLTRSEIVSLILIQILWSNMHASALLGPLIVLIFSIRKPKLLYFVPVLMVSMMLNPFGFQVYLYPLNHILSDRMLAITSDWSGPNMFHGEISFAAWGAVVLAAVSGIMIFVKKRVNLPALILTIITLGAGFWAARFMPLSLISLGWLLGDLVSGSKGEALCCGLRRGLVVASALVITMSIAGSIFAGPPTGLRIMDGKYLFVLGRKAGVGIAKEDFPERAAIFIKAMGLNGNMFNDMAYGGYLIYMLWPSQKVFIDTRTQVYGDLFISNYSNTLFDEQIFNNFVKAQDISYVIYDPRQLNAPGGPLKFLLNNDRWKLFFSSDKAVIFIRLDD
ncbi:MAG: hypothetical protein HN337_09360 [Deltaproteobacteria bacterium]|nr:hypothetical protein [Deltaproteobacteria bacterium]